MDLLYDAFMTFLNLLSFGCVVDFNAGTDTSQVLLKYLNVCLKYQLKE